MRCPSAAGAVVVVLRPGDDHVVAVRRGNIRRFDGADGKTVASALAWVGGHVFYGNVCAYCDLKIAAKEQET